MGAKAGWVIVLALVAAGPALAQSNSGKITGTVRDAFTGKPVFDVVVVATSPALTDDAVTVSNGQGEFELSNLPPGTYLLHFENDSYKSLNMPNVIVGDGLRRPLDVPLLPSTMSPQEWEEPLAIAPELMIDIGSTKGSWLLWTERLSTLPLPRLFEAGGAVRSFEGLGVVAPETRLTLDGLATMDAPPNENGYFIDGLNVADVRTGRLGMPLTIDFMELMELNVGAYRAESGHATASALIATTKSGGNEFHGSLSLFVEPGLLSASAGKIDVAGQSLSSARKLDLNANVGAEVGGYLIKDKLWFYAGLEPTFTQSHLTRTLRQVEYARGCPVDRNGAPVASASDPSFDHFSAAATQCADSLKGVGVDPNYRPVPLGTSELSGSEQRFRSTAFGYQYLAKLTYFLNNDQTFTISAFGDPTSGDSLAAPGQTFSASALHTESDHRDVIARWNGSFLDKHILTEAVAGWHRDFSDESTLDPAADRIPGVRITRVHSLADFDPDAAGLCGADDGIAAAEERKYELTHAPADIPTRYPVCRVNRYQLGGPGLLTRSTGDRYALHLELIGLFRWFGHHEVKTGLDLEWMRLETLRHFSGGALLEEYANSQNAAGGYVGFRDVGRYGYLAGPDSPVFADARKSVTTSTAIAGYVQDNWRVLDLFTVNLGLRWESQQLFDAEGRKAISLPYNVMPRAGVIFDPTHMGRGKLFANYGLFYEQLPLDILDRRFPVASQVLTARSTGEWISIGGSSAQVDRELKGQLVRELVVGGESELLPDVISALTFTHRDLGRAIEDVSFDGGQTFWIANPGYGIASAFPEATRQYDGFGFSLHGAFTRRWHAYASYTLSRLEGNYGGLYQADFNQLRPNNSFDFNSLALTTNTTGPLPGDHTHSVKLYVAHEIFIDDHGDVSIGVGYTALSGGPTNYRGSDPVYGPGSVFILPRGSGDRLPWIHELDLKVAYTMRLGDERTLSFSAEVFNLPNLRQATAVDEIYTFDNVRPLAGGTVHDLPSVDSVSKNPNFGHAIAYQSPRTVRLGIKFAF